MFGICSDPRNRHHVRIMPRGGQQETTVQRFPDQPYMDDYLESSSTVEEAARKAKDLVALLSLGGFKLTKIVSNVPCIPAMVQPDFKAPTKVKEIPNTEDSSRVLELKWNHSTDTLIVSRGTKLDVKPNVTQRVVLSLVSAV